jgi:hypothetical protein
VDRAGALPRRVDPVVARRERSAATAIVAVERHAVRAGVSPVEAAAMSVLVGLSWLIPDATGVQAPRLLRARPSVSLRERLQ